MDETMKQFQLNHVDLQAYKAILHTKIDKDGHEISAESLIRKGMHPIRQPGSASFCGSFFVVFDPNVRTFLPVLLLCYALVLASTTSSEGVTRRET